MNASERAGYAPSWYTATMVPASERGALTFDLDVEVCVIGGGLAAERIAWNASGRNDGFVLPGFAESMDRVVSRVGIDHAKALWALSEGGLEYVRSTIRDTGMPGVDPVGGWLKVSKTDNGDQMMADLELYGQELGHEIEGWPAERVRAVLKTNHYFHALHLPRAFHIHPLNSRSTSRAYASGSRRRTRACAPAISCWRATSTSVP